MNITITKPCAISEKSYRANIGDPLYPSPEVVTSSQRLFLLGSGQSKNSIAGALACEYFRTFFNAMLDDGIPTPEFIRKAIRYTEVNFDMYVKEHPEATGMSAALAMIHINPAGVTVANVGDNRIYLFRHGKIIYRSAGKRSSESNRRAIQGANTPAEADITQIRDLQPDDRIFIHTGEKMKSISDEELSTLFRKPLSPESLKDELVELCESRRCNNYSFYIIPIRDVQRAASYKQTLLSLLYSLA